MTPPTVSHPPTPSTPSGPPHALRTRTKTGRVFSFPDPAPKRFASG